MNNNWKYIHMGNVPEFRQYEELQRKLKVFYFSARFVHFSLSHLAYMNTDMFCQIYVPMNYTVQFLLFYLTFWLLYTWHLIFQFHLSFSEGVIFEY